VDVQGTVQREKRKAKASVLGRVDNDDLKLVCQGWVPSFFAT
jgi:hypothetical protein